MMSGKRFSVENERTVKDNYTYDCFVCSWKTEAEELVNLLNSLSEENEQLKQQLKTKHIVNKQYEELQRLKEENEHFRKSRDKWKTKALQKDEQLKDCDNDCFTCRFYNRVCDFCTKFHIYPMTSDDNDE